MAKKIVEKKTSAKKKLTKGNEVESVFAVGFKIQIDDYEPVSVFASEKIIHDGSRNPKELNLEMAQTCMKRLAEMSPDVGLKIAEIKQAMVNELSEPEEHEDD